MIFKAAELLCSNSLPSYLQFCKRSLIFLFWTLFSPLPHFLSNKSSYLPHLTTLLSLMDAFSFNSLIKVVALLTPTEKSSCGLTIQAQLSPVHNHLLTTTLTALIATTIEPPNLLHLATHNLFTRTLEAAEEVPAAAPL